MAGRADSYRAELRRLRDWEPFLATHSGLPGARANLELVQVVGDEAPRDVLWRWSTSSDEFLALCGTAGLGRFALEDVTAMPRLKSLAGDPRWRVREGVAIALQRIGKRDMRRLLKEMGPWARSSSAYVQRAAAAALCEPPLLKDEQQVRQVLDILDRITRSLAAASDRRSDEFKVLRQALGYCWSVAVAAAPEAGRPLMEKWLGSDDPDVRWVMKSNLAKSRMAKVGITAATPRRTRPR